MKSESIFLILKRQISWKNFVLIAIGVIIGTIASNWSFFTFDPSIEISDLISVLIGGYIGVYVGSKLTSQVSSGRIEKDLLIDQIKGIKSLILKVQEYVDTNSLSFEECKILFKDIGQKTEHLKEMLKECGYNQEINRSVTKTGNKIRKTYRQLTMNGPNQSGNVDVSQIGLSASSGLTSCNNDLMRLIITINRA